MLTLQEQTMAPMAARMVIIFFIETKLPNIFKIVKSSVQDFVYLRVLISK